MTLDYMVRWIEHFLVLPFRWYRLHCRNWREMRQRCKVCGSRDKLDFHVADDVWREIVPRRYQNRVVCLACFDDFAKAKGADFSTALDSVVFAGDQVSLDLEPS